MQLNEANNWSATVTGLLKYEAGIEIVYSWTEQGISGYELSSNVTEKTIKGTLTTLTNKHEPVKTSVSGMKYWSDYEDRDRVRPTAVTVQLLANGTAVAGKTATVGADENWSWKFEGLPMYENGKSIVYTVSESAVSGYRAEYSGMNVTNIRVTPPPPPPDEPGEPGEPETTPTPYRPPYNPPRRTPVPTKTPSPTPPIERTRVTPTPGPTETVVPTDVPTTVPTPEPRKPQPVQKGGEPPYHMSHHEIEEYIEHIEEIYKFKLPTIIIDDLGVPLGLGAVFINVGDCLE